ncbi:pH-sensitive chloride channel 2-like [Adelges cooleyi]|uniref:pH-sensitive chloride channel 2-like n=1 Tax=Adelges cooleyi TaxID=133065 RepID=UPI00217FF0AE|nr:pH-sensitive chloride channel 2-like [Adelges cooleyi]XP_050420263.1 pH-sensitive chloride channel 2-like [Adelges cooleyi]XP_050420264.1 pH-sensitive chloride channel 2-like [Adelges cooleyi]
MLSVRGLDLVITATVVLILASYFSSSISVHAKCTNYDTADHNSLIKRLMWQTEPCRYNSLTRPIPESGPTRVWARVDKYIIRKSSTARQLNLTPDVLIKFRWRDSRLAHSLSNLNVRGKDKLKQRIWTPLVDIVNYDTDSDPQDILETVQPDGTVIYSARLEVPSELCTMNLEKFPFDKQKCSLLLQSLLYNNTDLELLWEHVSPEELRSSLEFTQYNLASIRTTVTVSDHYEELADNYSQLKLYYELGRKLGVHTVAYYFLGFFMVVMSWGSFWLEPNEASGRVNIGIYPMMALIVQYLYSERLQPILLNIKEIWLLVCISFIVSSLMVSAVAHFISRQNKQFKLTLIPQVLRKLLSIVGSKLDKFEWNRGVDENERSTIARANTVEHVMTSQEFALWMDRLSRVLFPVAFLLFNCIYWFYVYV